MAHHKSAKKRARQSEKRRARNRHVRGAARTAVKNARTALEGGDASQTAEAVRTAESLLRRAASKGVLSKRHVSRRVSRLARAAHRAET